MSNLLPFPDKKYSVIYCDPPWDYDDARDQASAGMARSAYPTMVDEELCKLPVRSLCTDRTALVMWGTWPKMHNARVVMEAWGFKYLTVGWVWVKTTKASPPGANWICLDKEIPLTSLPKDAAKLHRGLGWYTRGNTEYAQIGVPVNEDVEFALLGRIGKALARLDLTLPQVVFAPVGAHSAKPAEVRAGVDALFGDVPRIELFSRERCAGWDSWGNQTPPDNPLIADSRRV